MADNEEKTHASGTSPDAEPTASAAKESEELSAAERLDVRRASGTSPEHLVWIIVLHWQGSHYTRACLASLRALSYRHYKILLVDNGSPDLDAEPTSRDAVSRGIC